jgi:prepilin-type N-terminal cleavage/methylation domain-containing protein
MRGFSLLELMTVVALLAILSALSVTGLQPLMTRFRQQQAADATAQFLVRARQRALETGRCHGVEVLDSGAPVVAGTPGTVLRMRSRPTADCEVSAASVTFTDVETLTLPERMQVKQETAGTAVYLPNGRLQGGARMTWWVGTDAPREVRALANGPVCVIEAGGGCP